THWALWSARPEGRGQILIFLYKARNSVFGIKPTSSRKIIPGPFAKNWAALEEITSLAEQSGVQVFLYIVPLRNDVNIQYEPTEYAWFKEKFARDFGSRPSVKIANLESTVSNDQWGTKASTSLDGEPEYDFMHFRAKGHEALADALFKII